MEAWRWGRGFTLPSLMDVWTQLLDLSERNFSVLSTDEANSLLQIILMKL